MIDIIKKIKARTSVKVAFMITLLITFISTIVLAQVQSTTYGGHEQRAPTPFELQQTVDIRSNIQDQIDTIIGNFGGAQPSGRIQGTAVLQGANYFYGPVLGGFPRGMAGTNGVGYSITTGKYFTNVGTYKENVYFTVTNNNSAALLGVYLFSANAFDIGNQAIFGSGQPSFCVPLSATTSNWFMLSLGPNDFFSLTNLAGGTANIQTNFFQLIQ